LALHASTEPDMTPSGDQQQLPADSTSKTPISSSSNRPSPASLIGSADTSPPLPLTVDSTLVTNPTANRRYLGENADPSLRPSINQFVATPDNRVIIACGYFDGSIRVFSVDTGRCVHIAYAHHSVVTCLARSEANATLHCYVATGGREGLVMLWIFNSQTMTFFSESAGEPPSPQATLAGHQDAIECVVVSAELGLVVSGSAAETCLIHTTRGDLLRRLVSPLSNPVSPSTPLEPSISAPLLPAPLLPARVLINREGYLVFQFHKSRIATYTLNGKLIRSVDMIRQVRPVDTEQYSISALAITPCSGYLLVGGNDGLVWILRTENLEPLHCLPRCKAPITAFALNHDQR
uniref:NBCH_WD40 domain-containing protein n=1 Tax=Schistocephalus solidus TaxID=70667 RepID=A0A183S8E4_SCHSO